MQLDIPALIKTLSEPNIAALSLCRVSPPTSFLEAVTCVFSCKLLVPYQAKKSAHIGVRYSGAARPAGDSRGVPRLARWMARIIC